MSVGRTEYPGPARPTYLGPRRRRGRKTLLARLSLILRFLVRRSLALDRGADVLFDHAAVEQVDAAIGVRRVTRIVGDHADGRAAAMQFPQELHHRFAVFRVEVTGRFVRQQDRRLAGDGAGHGDALLLT